MCQRGPFEKEKNTVKQCQAVSSSVKQCQREDTEGFEQHSILAARAHHTRHVDGTDLVGRPAVRARARVCVCVCVRDNTRIRQGESAGTHVYASKK